MTLLSILLLFIDIVYLTQHHGKKNVKKRKIEKQKLQDEYFNNGSISKMGHRAGHNTAHPSVASAPSIDDLNGPLLHGNGSIARLNSLLLY